ncbi:sensor histidine kinase, partial [Bacteroidota bacterium]
MNRLLSQFENNFFIKVFFFATLLALFFVGQQYFWNYLFDRDVNFITQITYELLYTYSWGLLILSIIVPLGNKFRIERGTFKKYIPVHVTAALIVALLQKLISSLPYFLIFYPDMLSGEGLSKVVGKILGGSFDSFIIYWFILGAYYGLDYYNQLSKSKLKESQLEKELAQANLQALKMQLHPHFLFNTLHAVSTLMQEDIKTARRMLAKLSDLLRVTLDNVGVQIVELNDEIDFLKSYLEIEQIRFGDRLQIVYEIEQETLSARVPNLILQPLVENAIKHGISNNAEGGKIVIKTYIDSDSLVLSVCDDGKFNGNKFTEGIGLSNTRKRLNHIY